MPAPFIGHKLTNYATWKPFFDELDAHTAARGAGSFATPTIRTKR